VLRIDPVFFRARSGGRACPYSAVVRREAIALEGNRLLASGHSRYRTEGDRSRSLGESPAPRCAMRASRLVLPTDAPRSGHEDRGLVGSAAAQGYAVLIAHFNDSGCRVGDALVARQLHSLPSG